MIILTAQVALAQSGVSPYYQVQQPMSGRIVVIPAGTTFEGRIDITIGSAISKQGTRFNVAISSPVLANGSDVLIPAGAEVIGEVVQAVPASQVPHKKKEKPPGQLRVQITALKMPDGMTFPLVASLIGEEAVSINPYGGFSGTAVKNPTLGSGIGYVGTQSGFHIVAPGPKQRNGYNSGSTSPVVTKDELMSDPIMGREHDMDENEKTAIRSLVKKNRNLYIYAGSPLTIRLEAPFKMGMSSSAGEASALGVKPLQPEESSIPTQAPPPSGPIQFGSQPLIPAPQPIPPQRPNQYTVTPSTVSPGASVQYAPPPLRVGKPQDSNF